MIIENTPQSMGSLVEDILTSARDSQNIGKMEMAEVNQKLIGLELSKPGSEIRLPVTFQKAVDPWMGTKALLALLEPQVSFSVKWSQNLKDMKIQGYTVKGNTAEAVKLLKASLTPAPKDVLVKELTKLATKTAMRKEEQGDLKLKIAAYLEELEQLPADMAIHALKTWPRRPQGKWFPSWAELYGLVEPELRDRQLLLEACYE